MQTVSNLESRNETLTKRNRALAMRLTRTSAAKIRASEKAHCVEAYQNPATFALKEKGVFTDTSRAMVRDLVANLDVPIQSVNATINVVAEALGVEVDGEASGRSIRRMVTEGGIAAETQLVDEISHAKGMSVVFISRCVDLKGS
ncbi:hypothetical protein M405DRAFT_864584 [Rhizopogon salebrosus TDB-379]|nr:hypothetical protein M405DRAFT_864584 [Rhizopogon salebrosus TDB-379]